MVHVPQRLKPSGIFSRHPDLTAYVARAEARPAYRRAFAAQLPINAPV
jgi:glutathione S-transferase